MQLGFSGGSCRASRGDRESLHRRSLQEWTLYGAGFVATVIAIVLEDRLARRALASCVDTGAGEGDSPWVG